MTSHRVVLAIFFAAAVLAATLPAQPSQPVGDPMFKNVRIALRFGSEQVLIVGGEIRGAIVEDTSINKFPKATHDASLLPGELIYLVPAQALNRFQFEPDTKWRVGDRWKLYRGAGPPVTVVIQSLAVILYCGGLGGYAAAIATFEGQDAANSIAGLRASEYLATPGQELAAVSGAPLMPVEAGQGEPTRALGQLLLSQARGIVKNADWMIEPNTRKSLADRTRRMNQLFLTGARLEPEIRYSRWSPPGRAALLFVEALWIDKSNLPLFACDAVVEEGNALTILWFSATQAEYMRMGEFANNTWKLDGPTAFLNAWKIGNRCFVLSHDSGYEEFRVRLMELVPGKGLVPVGPGFGAGC
jgi:hypothetical protein